MSDTFEGVKAVLVETLGIDDRAASLTPSTPLFGSMPEFDSMAVVEFVVALEKHFSITIDEEDVTADVFATIGSVADLVESRR